MVLAAPAEGATIRDEFDAVSYSGNNGTSNWTGDWIEVGESNGPGTGFLRVVGGGFCTAGNCFRLGEDGENSNPYLWREADPVFVNTNYTYTLTTTNDGPDASNNVTVVDSLPASVAFQSATPTQGGCVHSGQPFGGTVTCNVGTLANGANATVNIVVNSSTIRDAAEELAIFTAVNGAPVLTDALGDDVVSYAGATVDAGNGNVGNLQLDINANTVWAILFSVKMP